MSILFDIAKTVQGKSIEKAPLRVQESRINTCEYCPFLNWGKRVRSCGKYLQGGTVNYQGQQMELCGCNVDDKVKYLNDACPLGKW